jgi:hypothetical protein
LDQLEASNIATALKLQHRWTNYMIGQLQPAQLTLRCAEEAEAAGVPATSSVTLGLPRDWDVVSLRSLASAARDVLMNPRSAKPFSFSLSGSFSHSSKERRRMELVVTKAEKQTLDEWIRCLDKKELWKVRRAQEAAEAQRHALESLTGGGIRGLGAGKAPPERVDSKYGELEDATNIPAAVAAHLNQRQRGGGASSQHYLSQMVASSQQQQQLLLQQQQLQQQ